MPDWITYVLSAWVLCEIAARLGAKNARSYVGVAAVGSVLPDLVKALFLLKTLTGVDLIAFTVPLATPIGAGLVAGLVSLFFQRNEIRMVLPYMLAGVVVHILWDLTLHPYGGGTLVFFPFSFEQYALGLIWSDSILPLLIITIPASVLLGNRILRGGPNKTGSRQGKGL